MQKNIRTRQVLTSALLSGVMLGGALIGSNAGLAPFGLIPAQAEEHDGHGGRSHHTPLTAAQHQAIYAAVLKRDNAFLAAAQAYVAAETTIFAGTTANTGNQALTTAQQQALDTAANTQDGAIRASQRLYDQTIAAILANTTTTGQTGVAVSSAEASVKNSVIQLHFVGALDPTAAEVATAYTVQINGIATTVESATYHNTHTVTLGLALGVLKSGDQVTVTWTGLKDIHGGAVAGNISVPAK